MTKRKRENDNNTFVISSSEGEESNFDFDSESDEEQQDVRIVSPPPKRVSRTSKSSSDESVKQSSPKRRRRRKSASSSDDDQSAVSTGGALMRHYVYIYDALPSNDIDMIVGRRPHNIIFQKRDTFVSAGSNELDSFDILVKFKNLSHWHDLWLPEQVVNSLAAPKLRYFNEKYRDENFVDLTQSDWCEVEQILNRNKDTYLVKWRGLPHEHSTFEHIADLEMRLDQDELHKLLHRFNAIKAYPLSGNPNFGNRDKLCLELAEQPAYIGSESLMLHPYQLEGLNWLRFKYSNHTNVILADEMGLGKTVQVIAFIASLYEEIGLYGPHLIVCPLSTVPNWQKEFERWAPQVNCVPYTGVSLSKEMIKKHMIFNQTGDMLKANVILTTNETLLTHSAKWLREMDFKVLIVDEAHRMKSQSSKTLNKLKSYQYDHVVLLTGTPLQNNLQELWNLLNFIEPNHFSRFSTFEVEFKEYFDEETSGSAINSMLSPYILRRLKQDVLGDLPSKLELLVKVPLAPAQKYFYKRILERNADTLVSIGSAKLKSSRFSSIFLRLLQCCMHPYLFLTEDEEPKANTPEEGGRLLIHASSKLLLMDKMLLKLQEKGHRVLVYSQSTQMLTILEDYATFRGFEYRRIDGAVKGPERQKRIDEFNSDPSIFLFLLSTRAGGLGINLQAADTIFIYDSDWNPMLDDQAMSRAHRMGQEKTVMVYRLTCVNTVEERVLQIANNKKILEQMVVKRFNDLKDVLKYGAQQLFEESRTSFASTTLSDSHVEKRVFFESSLESLGFTDEDIDKLISVRNGEDAETVYGHSDSLKVSLCSLPTKINEIKDYDYREGGMEIDSEDSPIESSSKDDASYWGKLLKDHSNTKQKQTAKQKSRLRKRSASKKKYDSDNRSSSSESDSDDDDFVFHDTAPRASSRSKKKNSKTQTGIDLLVHADQLKLDLLAAAITKKPKIDDYYEKRNVWKRPPLMSGSGASMRVLGFTYLQRKTFIELLMRYGVQGKSDDQEEKWRSFYQRVKMHRAFASSRFEDVYTYGSWFIGRMAEVKETDTQFAGKVPTEGAEKMKRAIFDRLANMHMITMKVEAHSHLQHGLKHTDDRKKLLEEFDIEGDDRIHQHWQNPTSYFAEWRKIHDIQLLRAVTKHGYGVWSTILEDPEFSELNVALFAEYPPVVLAGEALITKPYDRREKRYAFLSKRLEVLQKALCQEYRRKSNPSLYPPAKKPQTPTTPQVQQQAKQARKPASSPVTPTPSAKATPSPSQQRTTPNTNTTTPPKNVANRTPPPKTIRSFRSTAQTTPAAKIVFAPPETTSPSVTPKTTSPATQSLPPPSEPIRPLAVRSSTPKQAQPRIVSYNSTANINKSEKPLNDSRVFYDEEEDVEIIEF